MVEKNPLSDSGEEGVTVAPYFAANACMSGDADEESGATVAPYLAANA
jgi:hypothetical protein